MHHAPRVSTHLSEVNGTRLYHEVRGRGPALLFVPGATGDAGHFDAVADRLADHFTVVTYDRRANSRSPRPPGWTTTTIEQQADDAAALVEKLGLGPVGLFGTSGGAIIALCMLLRRPDLVRAAVLHEPPLARVVDGAEHELEAMKRSIGETIRLSGTAAALEAFLRAADAAVDRIPQGTFARMRGNATTLFATELDAFTSFLPDDAALTRVATPVHVLVGARPTELHRRGAAWLAERLRVPLRTIGGGHTPYFEHPDVLAAELRPLFELEEHAR